MKKPIKPRKPKTPAILEGVCEWDGPQKTYEEILYETPTNLSEALKEYKKRNPKASNRKICNDLGEENGWEMYLDSDGLIRARGDIDNHPHNYIRNREGISMSDILNDLTPEEQQEVYVQGVSNYYGDYLHGPAGVRVTITRENTKYKEQVKAFKPWKKKLEEFCDKWTKRDRDWETP